MRPASARKPDRHDRLHAPGLYAALSKGGRQPESTLRDGSGTPTLRASVLEDAAVLLGADDGDLLDVAVQEGLERMERDLAAEQLEVLLRDLGTHALPRERIACRYASFIICQRSGTYRSGAGTR